MIIRSLITIVQLISQFLFLLILAYVLFSYLLPQSNSFRRFVDRVIEPLLGPIRRIVPVYKGIDFSPIILVILLQVVTSILILMLGAIG